jgi:class 3 adenylate cyclase
VGPGETARVMATILFTDMVGSTEQRVRPGDAAWKQTVAMHDDVVRTVLVRFGGREVETAGDSFLIVFDSAESAVRCGLALIPALDAIRLPIRVGIHSGEVVMADDHVRGLAVHAAARILDQAGSGEVLVSGTTRDLAEGATGGLTSSLEADTVSRAWSENTSSSPRRPLPRPEEPFGSSRR